MQTKWQEKREKGRKSLTQVWNVLKCEVIGKKTKEGNKEKKLRASCVEEVVGKKRKE